MRKTEIKLILKFEFIYKMFKKINIFSKAAQAIFPKFKESNNFLKI